MQCISEPRNSSRANDDQSQCYIEWLCICRYGKINEAFRRDGIMALEVEDAIIIATREGTRMLPASLYSPKEFLPLIDVPAIHHIISETLRAGIKRIHIVISEKKRIWKNYFHANESRPSSLTTENIKPILSRNPNDLEYIIHVQEEQRESVMQYPVLFRLSLDHV